MEFQYPLVLHFVESVEQLLRDWDHKPLEIQFLHYHFSMCLSKSRNPSPLVSQSRNLLLRAVVESRRSANALANGVLTDFLKMCSNSTILLHCLEVEPFSQVFSCLFKLEQNMKNVKLSMRTFNFSRNLQFLARPSSRRLQQKLR